MVRNTSTVWSTHCHNSHRIIQLSGSVLFSVSWPKRYTAFVSMQASS